MKKLFFVSFYSLLAISVFAQKGKVTSASLYIESYKNGEGAVNLDEALKNIDPATKDETTSSMGKTWWVRAQMYQFMAMDTTFRVKQPTAIFEAMKSYQKLIELNDPKFKDWDEAKKYMKDASLVFFNKGIEAFTKKNYHDAYLAFSSISTISDMVISKGDKLDGIILNNALTNAGLSAENDGDNNAALPIYKKLLTVAPDSTKLSVYISLINLNKKMKNIDESKKITDEALAKYPGDKDLLLIKINYYLSDQKYQEAISYLKQALSQDPKSESIMTALGVSYEQTGDSVNAQKVYENLYAMNPNSFDANYGLGSVQVKKAHDIEVAMNNIKGLTKEEDAKYEVLKKQRNAVFVEAKKYLSKAMEIKNANPKIKDIEPTVPYIQSTINHMDVLLKQ